MVAHSSADRACANYLRNLLFFQELFPDSLLIRWSVERPVEPSAEAIIPGREARQPHDTRGIAQCIEHDHQTGAEIAERHQAGGQQPPAWHATVPRGGRGRHHGWWSCAKGFVRPCERGISYPVPLGCWDRSPIPPTSR